MNSTTQHPLLALKELDDLYRGQRNYSLQATLGDWRGLAVRTSSYILLFDSRQVQEVIADYHTLPLSQIPGAKSWFVGLVSLRTQLLPIIDLCTFLGLPESRKRKRVVVLKRGVGLLVDDTIGMRYFRMSEQARQGPVFGGRISEFLAGVFLRDEQYLAVIDLGRLSQDADFASVAQES